MFDNALITLIGATLQAGMAAAGITPDIPIVQAFQPTQQGVNTTTTAYLYKIGDKRFGFPYWADIWDPVHSVFVHTELQKYETTFQLSALSTQDPSNQSQLTASDIVNLMSSIMQSASTVATFQTNNIGIERVGDIRNPYFQDDRQQFEASPSFDFVIQHDQIIQTTTPILQSEEFDIYPV